MLSHRSSHPLSPGAPSPARSRPSLPDVAIVGNAPQRRLGPETRFCLPRDPVFRRTSSGRLGGSLGEIEVDTTVCPSPFVGRHAGSVDLPVSSRATIYKTLETLKELGEVLELEFRDGGNRYDGVRPEAHPHLICTRCGKIEDLELPGLEELPRRAAEQSGYRISSYRCDLTFGKDPRTYDVAARIRPGPPLDVSAGLVHHPAARPAPARMADPSAGHHGRRRTLHLARLLRRL